jgi:hypothetical protein
MAWKGALAEERVKKRKSRLASRAAFSGLAVMTLGVGINGMSSLCTSPLTLQPRPGVLLQKVRQPSSGP